MCVRIWWMNVNLFVKLLFSRSLPTSECKVVALFLFSSSFVPAVAYFWFFRLLHSFLHSLRFFVRLEYPNGMLSFFISSSSSLLFLLIFVFSAVSFFFLFLPMESHFYSVLLFSSAKLSWSRSMQKTNDEIFRCQFHAERNLRAKNPTESEKPKKRRNENKKKWVRIKWLRLTIHTIVSVK